MTNNENTLMEQYGIIREKRYIYRYKTYQYNNLQDAVNYAKLDSGGSQENAGSIPNTTSTKISS